MTEALRRGLVPHSARALQWLARAAFVALALWLCTGSTAHSLLTALLPGQRALLSTLLPDFDIHQLVLQSHSGHLKLHAASRNRRYLVIRGRAVEPGFAFEVETPARVALLHAALIVAGLALTVRPTRRGLFAAAVVGVSAVAGLLWAAPAVLLAGQQWGLVLDGGDEFSLPALWLAASRFLIHGGAYALCAAALGLVAAWGSPPASDRRIGAGMSR